MLGFGLPLGLGTVTEGCTARLGVGVSVLGGGWLVWCDGVVAGGLRCCAVLVLMFPQVSLQTLRDVITNRSWFDPTYDPNQPDAEF